MMHGCRACMLCSPPLAAAVQLSTWRGCVCWHEVAERAWIPNRAQGMLVGRALCESPISQRQRLRWVNSCSLGPWNPHKRTPQRRHDRDSHAAHTRRGLPINTAASSCGKGMPKHGVAGSPVVEGEWLREVGAMNLLVQLEFVEHFVLICPAALCLA